MINKVHFGKRIAKLRKEHKITQVELAERLGVTSQAVSKWECGAALPDVELLLELSHLYDTSINDMLEEENIFEKIANRPYEYNGIAYFIPNKEHPWNKEWARRLVEEKWVETNWKHFPKEIKFMKTS